MFSKAEISILHLPNAGARVNMLYEAKYAELSDYLWLLLLFAIIRNYISNELVDLGLMKIFEI